MLQRTTYMTASQLDIPQDWYDGLVKTVDYLEKSPSETFSMRQWNVNYQSALSCRTVRCIGGTAAWLGDVEMADDYMLLAAPDVLPNALYQLFFPFHYYDAWRATKIQAATVVRHYLQTGIVDWEYAMKTVD